MRSPGTTSRAHDRGSGDPDAIRCDFGLAPVAKRFRPYYSSDDSPQAHCPGTPPATGPWPPSGKAESAGRRITRCEAEDTSTPEPWKRRRQCRTVGRYRANLYYKGRSELKCSRAEWRGCEFLGRIPPDALQSLAGVSGGFCFAPKLPRMVFKS